MVGKKRQLKGRLDNKVMILVCQTLLSTKMSMKKRHEVSLLHTKMEKRSHLSVSQNGVIPFVLVPIGIKKRL